MRYIENYRHHRAVADKTPVSCYSNSFKVIVAIIHDKQCMWLGYDYPIWVALHTLGSKIPPPFSMPSFFRNTIFEMLARTHTFVCSFLSFFFWSQCDFKNIRNKERKENLVNVGWFAESPWWDESKNNLSRVHSFLWPWASGSPWSGPPWSAKTRSGVIWFEDPYWFLNAVIVSDLNFIKVYL